MGFDPTRIGAEFRYNDGTVTGAGPTSFQVVPPNPYRVWIGFQSSVGNTFLRMGGLAGGNTGFILTNTPPPLAFSLHEHGPLCQQSWFAQSSAGATVYFLEVLWVQPLEA